MSCTICGKEAETYHPIEVSYESFDFYCPECMTKKQKESEEAQVRYFLTRKNDITLELNEYGNWTIWCKTSKPSGRADGKWMVGAFSPAQHELWLELLKG
jgi:hypothetical protein